jgi:hypothetical protein
MKKRSARRRGRARRATNLSTGRDTGTIVSGFRRYPGPIQMPPAQSIMIQLRNGFAGITNGSGVFGAVIPCDPSVTLSSAWGSVSLFPEYSDWLALFGQIKCVALEVKMLPQSIDEVKGDTPGVLNYSSNLQTVAVPTSAQQVADNADSNFWNVLSDSTSMGRYISLRHKKSIGWAASGTPVPSNSNYIGCPGGIAFYANGLPVNTGIIYVHVTGTYMLMNRT